MERFVKGDVVVVPFPFSDLSSSKNRPAFVINDLSGDDIILCQITSQAVSDKFAIKIISSDFTDGSLPQPTSNIRPNKLFTADKNIIIKKAGKLKSQKITEIINKLVEIIRK
jgi:mRNA interferase MazF